MEREEGEAEVRGVVLGARVGTGHEMGDGPNAVPLKHMRALLETLLELDRVTKKNGFLENNFGL